MDMDVEYRIPIGADCQHEGYPVYETDMWHSQNAKNHDFFVQFSCKPPRDFFSLINNYIHAGRYLPIWITYVIAGAPVRSSQVSAVHQPAKSALKQNPKISIEPTTKN